MSIWWKLIEDRSYHKEQLTMPGIVPGRRMVAVDDVSRLLSEDDRLIELEVLTAALTGSEPTESSPPSYRSEDTSIYRNDYVPRGATPTPGVLPVLPGGTNPLDAIQDLLERMLHIDQCLSQVHQGPGPDSDYNRALQFRTIGEIKDAYMVLSMDSVDLDFEIQAYIDDHGATGTGLLYSEDEEIVHEENDGFKHEMGRLWRRILMVPNETN